ncbi:MAG: hypothetical protein OXF11_21535, partial [Deltaproteobacteria bacterium]|nr:hypothetical protein [Deltaproteobacteria bacterium]
MTNTEDLSPPSFSGTVGPSQTWYEGQEITHLVYRLINSFTTIDFLHNGFDRSGPDERSGLLVIDADVVMDGLDEFRD